MAALVYGASDDLIEVEGQVEEEFTVYGSGPHRIRFDNGVELSLTYEPEGWRVSPVNGLDGVVLIPAPGGDGNDVAGLPNSSNRAVVLGKVGAVELVS